MKIDICNVENRNLNIVKSMILYFNIQKSIEELISFESVFLSLEYKDKEEEFSIKNFKRLFLYANTKIDNKSKKIILYFLGRKDMKKLSEQDIEIKIKNSKLFVLYLKQLKLIDKVKKEEENLVNIDNEQIWRVLIFISIKQIT